MVGLWVGSGNGTWQKSENKRQGRPVASTLVYCTAAGV